MASQRSKEQPAPAPLIRTYPADSYAAAVRDFQADASVMARHGYQPTSQQWVPDDAGRGCFWIVVVIILLVTIVEISASSVRHGRQRQRQTDRHLRVHDRCVAGPGRDQNDETDAGRNLPLVRPQSRPQGSRDPPPPRNDQRRHVPNARRWSSRRPVSAGSAGMCSGGKSRPLSSRRISRSVGWSPKARPPPCQKSAWIRCRLPQQDHHLGSTERSAPMVQEPPAPRSEPLSPRPTRTPPPQSPATWRGPASQAPATHRSAPSRATPASTRATAGRGTQTGRAASAAECSADAGPRQFASESVAAATVGSSTPHTDVSRLMDRWSRPGFARTVRSALLTRR